MATLITKDDPQYESLYQLWLSEKNPGYVVTPGGAQFRVFVISEEEVKFEPVSSIDTLYNSRSTGALSR